MQLTIAVVEHDPGLFFQVAAGLIPALIFGGLISEKLKPPATPRGWTLIASLGVFAVALTVLQAEVTAITVALRGEARPFETWLVASVLVGLTAGALGFLAVPWYRHAFDTARGTGRYVGHGVIAAGTLAIVVLAVILLAEAVQGEQELQRLTAAQQELQRLSAELSEAREIDTTNEFFDAYDRMYQARAEAGLVPKPEARRVHVCLTDGAYMLALQSVADSLGVDSEPARDLRSRLPGKPIECDGLDELPSFFP